MLLKEYLPTSCDTSGLAGLTKQVASMLLDNLPAGEVLDISSHVVQAGATTIPFLQTEAATALIAAIDEKGTQPHLVHAVRVLPQQYAVHFWVTHNMGKVRSDDGRQPGRVSTRTRHRRRSAES